MYIKVDWIECFIKQKDISTVIWINKVEQHEAFDVERVAVVVLEVDHCPPTVFTAALVAISNRFMTLSDSADYR